MGVLNMISSTETEWLVQDIHDTFEDIRKALVGAGYAISTVKKTLWKDRLFGVDRYKGRTVLQFRDDSSTNECDGHPITVRCYPINSRPMTYNYSGNGEVAFEESFSLMAGGNVEISGNVGCVEFETDAPWSVDVVNLGWGLGRLDDGTYRPIDYGNCYVGDVWDFKNYGLKNARRLFSSENGNYPFDEPSDSWTYRFAGSFGEDIEVATGMFANNQMLKDFSAAGGFCSKATYMDEMFKGCSSLDTIELPQGFGTEAIHMSEIFSGCSSLEALSFGGAFGNKCTDLSGAFDGCEKLKYIYFNGGACIGTGVNFKDCPLTQQSVGRVLAALKDVSSTTGKVITFSQESYAYVTDAQKTEAEGKGWTVKAR